MYEDLIEEKCVGCKYHSMQLADADVYASSCKLYKAWCCNIKECKNFNK